MQRAGAGRTGESSLTTAQVTGQCSVVALGVRGQIAGNLSIALLDQTAIPILIFFFFFSPPILPSTVRFHDVRRTGTGIAAPRPTKYCRYSYTYLPKARPCDQPQKGEGCLYSVSTQVPVLFYGAHGKGTVPRYRQRSGQRSGRDRRELLGLINLSTPLPDGAVPHFESSKILGSYQWSLLLCHHISQLADGLLRETA